MAVETVLSVITSGAIVYFAWYFIIYSIFTSSCKKTNDPFYDCLPGNYEMVIRDS